jgi:hypothetical protein
MLTVQLTNRGGFAMNRLLCQPERATDNQLERVIEPLASYICAAKRPRAALHSALAALRHEVDQTVRAARAHVTFLSEHR